MTVPFAIRSRGQAPCGDLSVPADAAGMVVFAHGSGSSRHSPRNMAVARSLQDRRLATLLVDLLDPAEAAGGETFNLDLVAGRLREAIDGITDYDAAAGLPLGIFGASTGVAAALEVAVDPDLDVRAIVGRGGRPDLAGAVVSSVTAPTLLIVGANDPQVLSFNERAAASLTGQRELHIVPGATHLFEEAGALEEVAAAAGDWFTRFLRRD